MGRKAIWFLGTALVLAIYSAPAAAQVSVGIGVGAPHVGVGVVVGAPVYGAYPYAPIGPYPYPYPYYAPYYHYPYAVPYGPVYYRPYQGYYRGAAPYCYSRRARLLRPGASLLRARTRLRQRRGGSPRRPSLCGGRSGSRRQSRERSRAVTSTGTRSSTSNGHSISRQADSVHPTPLLDLATEVGGGNGITRGNGETETHGENDLPVKQGEVNEARRRGYFANDLAC